MSETIAVRRPGDREDPLPVLVERLQDLGSRQVGGKWQCPAHNDREPSLSVKRHRNELDIVFHCHAGCSDDSVREALGWEWPDFYHPDTRGRTTSPSVTSPLVSTSLVSARKRPDLATLEAEWKRGEREVTRVELGEMPDSATGDMRKVAADVAFLLGLFTSDGETRPMPYSARFGAERTGLDKMRVCRALKALVDARVLSRPRLLRAKNDQPRGTAVYAAPVLQDPDSARPVEVAGNDPVDVGGEVLGLDPTVVEGDELAVDGAVLVEVPVASSVGVVAAGDSARNVATRGTADQGGGIVILHTYKYKGLAVSSEGEEMPF